MSKGNKHDKQNSVSKTELDADESGAKSLKAEAVGDEKIERLDERLLHMEGTEGA